MTIFLRLYKDINDIKQNVVNLHYTKILDRNNKIKKNYQQWLDENIGKDRWNYRYDGWGAVAVWFEIEEDLIAFKLGCL